MRKSICVPAFYALLIVVLTLTVVVGGPGGGERFVGSSVVTIDGPITVFSIIEAVGEEFGEPVSVFRS
jgi:hypothetical protein